MGFTPKELATKGDNFNYSAIARMKPGVTIERAAEDVRTMVARIQEDAPLGIRKDFTVQGDVFPLHERVVSNVRSLLNLLLGAVGMVPLIACTNIANLLLARASGRKREMSVRAALGAGRWRLIRQSLAESMILSLAGGAAGLALARNGISGCRDTAIDSPRRGDRRGRATARIRHG